jgi:cyclase
MTLYKRLIARLDCKGSKVIKGIQLEGLRVVGPLNELARARYAQGADELFVLDAVASLYDGSDLPAALEELTRDCFIPITVGGGIRTIEDADRLFRAGADKVAVNTGAIRDPRLVGELANKYGSQAVVVHIEAKRSEGAGDKRYKCYVENGRDDSGIVVSTWAAEAVTQGAGEILVTSVDRDGTLAGPDLQLLQEVRASVNVPVVAASGFRNGKDVAGALKELQIDGVAIGSALHFQKANLDDIRQFCRAEGVNVR